MFWLNLNPNPGVFVEPKFRCYGSIRNRVFWFNPNPGVWFYLNMDVWFNPNMGVWFNPDPDTSVLVHSESGCVVQS